MSIRALYIGSNYAGTANALPDCELDCRNWRDTLAKWTKSAEMLLGKEASRANILRVGKQWLASLDKGDLGVLLFSQHGTREKIKGKWHEAIVCDDLELIYDFESAALLGQRKKGSFVVTLADTCHSGGMPRGNPRIARTIPLSRCRTHKTMPPDSMRALIDVIAYAGCDDEEYSYSTGDGGAMSLAMQQAFRERQLDTSFGWLYKRVAGKRPKGLLPTEEYPQTPQVEASARNLKRTLKEFVK